MLEILYKDDFIVAINKPHGLLVHQSKIARDAKEFAIQLLRDQINQKVYPVHRIDRKTSGVLLFALKEDVNIAMQEMFMNREVDKIYHAIVRGYAPEKMTIDYPLKREDGKIQGAVSNIRRISTVEIDLPFGKHLTSRYSLIEIEPKTGRFHQIRKHLAHIRHPIIADRPHGCNKQNKLFLEKFNLSTMMLHARNLNFKHPVTKEIIELKAKYSSEFERMLSELHFETIEYQQSSNLPL